MRRRVHTTHLAVLLAALAALTGCGSTDVAPTDQGYAVVAEPTLRSGEVVPSPQDDVVLTITGTEVTNVGDSLQFDLATLESLGLVEYEVVDSQATGEAATFQGVLLRDLLAVAGVADGAMLHTIALNDYAVDIPASDAAELPVLLATAMDGERMTVERYGPLRVIYPTSTHDLDPAVYDPRWIWQLDRIDVQP